MAHGGRGVDVRLVVYAVDFDEAQLELAARPRQRFHGRGDVVGDGAVLDAREFGADPRPERLHKAPRREDGEGEGGEERRHLCCSTTILILRAFEREITLVAA